jgi:hypothetical protein
VARTGRPPVPLEVKRRRGTDRADRTPAVTEVTILPMAAGTPEPPVDLGLAGRRLWGRVWNQAITWLSPLSDGEQVEELARVADDLEAARRRYRATTDPADARALVSLNKAFTEGLSALGFNPTARARLGLAEVKRVTKLEELRARRH